jgi:hypothetical protein
LSAVAGAQSPPPPAIPVTPPSAADSAIRIVVLTVGQGDQLYELFGHNAIWVHDPSTRTDMVFNWGVFDFNTPGFLPRFLRGDMRYTMAAETIQNTLAYYQYYNRRMWGQELDLTPAQKRSLVDFLRWNILPENRQYRYNYYLDNCSTRVRDAIDRVLGGKLRAYLQGIPTDQTYRSHSLRMMQSMPLINTGVEVALGRSNDKLLTAHQASFLPVQLMGYMKDFKIDGRPLVLREFLVNEAARGPEPTTAPALWKGLVPIGLGLAGLLLVLSFILRARIATATGVALVAGIMGIVGLLIFLLATVTDHVAAHANENMWMLNPVWLVVAVALTRGVIKRRIGSVAKWSVLIGAGLGLCAVLMHLSGLSRQPNWDVIGLLLPVQLVMAGMVLRGRTDKSDSR